MSGKSARHGAYNRTTLITTSRAGRPPWTKAFRKAALVYHRLSPPGKIAIAPTKGLVNQRDLALAYTPGVAAEIFHGDFVEEFPDIILKPEDRYYSSPKFFRKRTKNGHNFFSADAHWRNISGSHRQYGIFIIKGPDCTSGLKLDSAEILDILPTTLYQMGLPIPADVDGKVIEGAFKQEFIKANPIRFEKVKGSKEEKGGDIYSDEDKSKLLDSLKGLGYIG